MDFSELLESIINALSPSEAEASPISAAKAAAPKVANIIEEQAKKMPLQIPNWKSSDINELIEYYLIDAIKKPMLTKVLSDPDNPALAKYKSQPIRLIGKYKGVGIHERMKNPIFRSQFLDMVRALDDKAYIKDTTPVHNMILSSLHVDLPIVAKKLVNKYRQEAPTMWDEAIMRDEEGYSPLLEAFTRVLLSDAEDYITRGDTFTRDIPGLIKGVMEPIKYKRPMSPKLSDLLEAPEMRYLNPIRRELLKEYIMQAKPEMVTKSGRISTIGQGPLSEILREFNKAENAIISEAKARDLENYKNMQNEAARLIEEAVNKFTFKEVPHTEFGDAIRRILREAPENQPIDMKYIKRNYQSIASRYGPELYSLLSKSGGDLRKATDDIFRQFSKVKNNPYIRTAWVKRPKNYENVWAISKRHLLPHNKQENLLVVGDPKIIYDINRHSPEVAEKYAKAVKLHAPMVGESELLPPLGWVEINKFKRQGKENWLITEVQSDLLSIINTRLRVLKDIAEKDINKLKKKQVNELVSEIQYLEDLKSKFKDWHKQALATVTEEARRRKVENIHILNPDLVSTMGLRGNEKLLTFYEDLPKQFGFQLDLASKKEVPINLNIYDVEGPAKIWSRIPSFVPPVALMPYLIHEDFLTQE